MKETARHVEAFEVWFDGGTPISYPEVSRRLSEKGTPASVTSLKKWSKAFDWQRRADERIAAVNQRLDVEVVDEIAKAKRQMIAVVDLALVRIQQALAGVPIECPDCGTIGHVPKAKFDVKDVAALVTAKLRLLGEPEKHSIEGLTLLDLVTLANDAGTEASS